MSILQLNDYKEFLQIDLSNTNEDVFLTSCQNEIEGWIKKYLGRDLELTTYTDELYDGDGGNILMLDQYPITDVISIHYYDGLDSNNNEIWTQISKGVDYRRIVIFKGGAKILIDGWQMPIGVQNIKCTYVAGYTESTMPQDIQMTSKQLMWIYYNSVRGASNLGKSSINTNAGGASTTINYNDNIIQTTLSNIERYRDLLI